jgi:hypothetical protein
MLDPPSQKSSILYLKMQKALDKQEKVRSWNNSSSFLEQTLALTLSL